MSESKFSAMYRQREASGNARGVLSLECKYHTSNKHDQCDRALNAMVAAAIGKCEEGVFSPASYAPDSVLAYKTFFSSMDGFCIRYCDGEWVVEQQTDEWCNSGVTEWSRSEHFGVAVSLAIVRVAGVLNERTPTA